MLRWRAAPLLLAAAALLAACGRGAERAADAHAKVACAGCHRGLAADSGRGPVPDAGCTTAACHPGGGRDSARVRTVVFRHAGHGGGAAAGVPCASCHTHRSGSARIVTDTTACALCHVKDLAEAGGRQPDCRSCHAHPLHTPGTSQGVAISHAQLDEARVPCTRCHYQVVEGNPARVDNCRGCHRDTTLLAVRSGDALHAGHRAFACASCHTPVRHRVVAMSTSVALACSDCHAPGHLRPIPADTAKGATCSACHPAVHAAQQRLILGLLPGEPIRPSTMFMGGVTCRSCHVAPGQPGPRPGRPLKANEAACTGCHGAQWHGILPRWQRGYQRRDAWVSAYLATAARTLADSGAAAGPRAQVREAQALLAFLRSAGPLHNLPASDRIMRRALELGASAYRSAGRAGPAVPELGPPVRTGSCMSCHYGIEEVTADRDASSGRPLQHADHLFRAFLSCDACHAVGAAPPGIPDSLWIDTLRAYGGDRGHRSMSHGNR